MKRRELLRLGGLGVLGTGLAGCASGVPSSNAGGGFARNSALGLAPVRVSWDRVIRTTVGLRPHRPAGFVVRAERMGDKLLIHNYGHGGAGMSLSWGTAKLAAELALNSPVRRAAVLGSGVTGLTTARQLQRRGFDVTLYAATVPPDTTSNMSLASFTPTSGLVTGSSATHEWTAQFRDAVQTAYGELQLLVGRGYGVSWIDSFSFRDEAPPPSRGSGGGGLLPAGLRIAPVVLGPGEHPFPARYATRRPTLRFEPSIYLEALVRDVRAAGARVVIRKFSSREQLATLMERVVVNCTGLGSRELFGDRTMVAVKGQLTVLVPQREVDYTTVGGIPGRGTNGGFPVHMLARSDGIILGGTSQRDEWSTEPDVEARNQIVEAHREFFGRMGGTGP